MNKILCSAAHVSQIRARNGVLCVYPIYLFSFPITCLPLRNWLKKKPTVLPQWVLRFPNSDWLSQQGIRT